MAEKSKSEQFLSQSIAATRSIAAWPRYMRLNLFMPRLELIRSDDPVDQEANRKKIERAIQEQEAPVLALGLKAPEYVNGCVVTVKGRVITDHGPENGVLVEFAAGHRAWIPYGDIQISSE